MDHSYAAAYQGEPGAFSEQAAWLLVGREADLLPCRTLQDVCAAVTGGEAREAIVPIENSLAGTVPRAYELLVEHQLAPVDEAIVHIDHMLIAHPSAQRADICRVLSHPVALDQCRRFIVQHGLEAEPVFDTAGAVTAVMAAGDPRLAAIASRRAAELHGAVVVAEHIQDHEENWTRFLRLSRPSAARDVGGRKAIVVFELRHECGSLGRALQHLAGLGLNLTKIESRPIAGRPFEYSFVIELTCGDAEPKWDHWFESFAGAVSVVRYAAVFGRAR